MIRHLGTEGTGNGIAMYEIDLPFTRIDQQAFVNTLTGYAGYNQGYATILLLRIIRESQRRPGPTMSVGIVML